MKKKLLRFCAGFMVFVLLVQSGFAANGGGAYSLSAYDAARAAETKNSFRPVLERLLAAPPEDDDSEAFEVIENIRLTGDLAIYTAKVEVVAEAMKNEPARSRLQPIAEALFSAYEADRLAVLGAKKPVEDTTIVISGGWTGIFGGLGYTSGKQTTVRQPFPPAVGAWGATLIVALSTFFFRPASVGWPCPGWIKLSIVAGIIAGAIAGYVLHVHKKAWKKARDPSAIIARVLGEPASSFHAGAMSGSLQSGEAAIGNTGNELESGPGWVDVNRDDPPGSSAARR